MQNPSSAGGRGLLHLVSYGSDSDDEKLMDESRPDVASDEEEDDVMDVAVAEPRNVANVKSTTSLVSYVGEEDDGRRPSEGDEKDGGEVSRTGSQESLDDDLEDRVNIENVKLVDSAYLNSSISSLPESSLSQKVRRLSAEEVTLPPEPQGRCSRHLQEKINSYYKKGYNLNQRIQRRKDFRNPSIYEKLISYLGIEELGTNYPKDMYDPYNWEESSYYEALSKAQRDEIQKRKEKEKKERTKVEFVTGMVKKPQIQAPLVTSTTGAVATTSQTSGAAPPEEEKKRKSKWDNPAPTIPAPVPLMQRPQVSVITTTITATSVVSTTLSATGAKTTVISSIGTIKKPKVEK